MRFITLPAKLPGESWQVQFDFAGQIPVGETISSASVSAAVYSGVDASYADVANGAQAISGTIVTKTIDSGVAGVIYLLTCSAMLSDTQVLSLQAYLAVQ